MESQFLELFDLFFSLNLTTHYLIYPENPLFIYKIISIYHFYNLLDS